MVCEDCGQAVDPLEQFPGTKSKAGIKCLDCYAKSPEGRRMPTAEQIVRMWGGKL